MRIRDPGSGTETVRIRDPGSGIQDPGWKKVGSGIRDKHPGSATLCGSVSKCHGSATLLYSTSGFWPRVRARALRAPAKLGLLTCQTERCVPLAHGSFAAFYTSPKNIYFQKQIASLLAQTRALPIAASLILSAIFWGQNVPVRPYALTF
jgi:hypothetical protein